MSANPWQSYQKTQVITAKPEKILVMLYEGAIKFNKLAQARMRENNIAEKGKYIGKVLSIIAELMNTLDHEVGGEVAADLENLYIFLMDQLIEANQTNQLAPLEAVERILITLHAAWAQIIENQRPGDESPSKALAPANAPRGGRRPP